MPKIKLVHPKTHRTVSFAYVDSQDVKPLKRYIWHLDPDGYAYRVHQDGYRIYMHRQVARMAGMEITDRQVDHKDRTRLNNYRSNLRPATAEQNSFNRKILGEQGLKGLSKVRVSRKLEDGRIRIDEEFAVSVDAPKGNKVKAKEVYACPNQAAQEYNRLARRHQGDFAFLNPVIAKAEPRRPQRKYLGKD